MGKTAGPSPNIREALRLDPSRNLIIPGFSGLLVTSSIIHQVQLLTADGRTHQPEAGSGQQF